MDIFKKQKLLIEIIFPCGKTYKEAIDLVSLGVYAGELFINNKKFLELSYDHRHQESLWFNLTDRDYISFIGPSPHFLFQVKSVPSFKKNQEPPHREKAKETLRKLLNPAVKDFFDGKEKITLKINLSDLAKESLEEENPKLSASPVRLINE